MLPKTEHPIYEFTVPSTKKVLNYRPFLTKEKKILLMALETQNSDDIAKAVRQIISNCVLDKKFDIGSLTSFDVELFFLRLRAKSDSEIVESVYRCENVVDEKLCNHPMDVKFNLMDINVQVPADSAKKIELSATRGIVMKYPTIDLIERNPAASPVQDAFNFIIDCVDFVYDGDNLTHSREVPRNELEEFIDNLPTIQFAKLEKFVENMPKVRNVVKQKCAKCQFEHEIAMEGLASFFE
jgi:hypothetical protein